MKKLACLMVVAVLLVVAMVPAFAASGINANEQKIIDYVKTGYVVDGKTITLPAEYMTALENVCASADVTDAQYTEIKAQLDKSLEYVKANNLKTAEDVKKAGCADELVNQANKALGVCGFNATVQGNLENGVIVITDSNNAVVAKINTAVVTKTGADYTSAAVCGVAAIAVLAVAGMSVKAFRKEDNED